MMRWRSRRGEVAVITGGANGIGKASAELWLQAGGSVVVADVDARAGKSFQEEVGDPRRLRFVRCDTTSRQDMEGVVRVALAMGRLTCWFSNAGVGFVEDEPLEKFDRLRRMVEINSIAYMLGAYLAFQHMDPSLGGTHIMCSSMAGLLPRGAPPVYSASKAFNIHFTRALASSSAASALGKVQAYCLCPSYTETALGPRAISSRKYWAEFYSHGIWPRDS